MTGLHFDDPVSASAWRVGYVDASVRLGHAVPGSWPWPPNTCRSCPRWRSPNARGQGFDAVTGEPYEDAAADGRRDLSAVPRLFPEPLPLNRIGPLTCGFSVGDTGFEPVSD